MHVYNIVLSYRCTIVICMLLKGYTICSDKIIIFPYAMQYVLFSLFMHTVVCTSIFYPCLAPLPLPLPTGTFRSLWVCCFYMFAGLFYFSISTYKWCRIIFVLLWLISPSSVIPSKYVLLLQMAASFFLWLSSILLYTPHLLIFHPLMDILGLLPHRGNYCNNAAVNTGHSWILYIHDFVKPSWTSWLGI